MMDGIPLWGPSREHELNVIRNMINLVENRYFSIRHDGLY